MKSKDDNLEKNISRLVKLAGDSNKPTKAFTDSLTDNAIDELKRPVRTKFTLLKMRPWLGTAAAVLLIGFLLLVPDLVRQGKQNRQSARKPGPIIQKPELEAASGEVLDKRNRVAARTDTAGIVADRLAEEIMPEKPPFAPASAIELVTLPRRDNVQITIYNSADLTLVRERRNLTLKKGWNWLQFMWANTLIDPTSLSLEPLAHIDKIDIQQLVFPARLKDIGRWLIRSETEGQVPFEITYFTSGLSWRAFYMGTLSGDERKMKLAGYVRVANNSGEDYENAQTRLIVGKVHQLDKIAELAKRQYPYGSPQKLEVGYDVSGMVDDERRFGIPYAAIRGQVILTAFESMKEITKEGLSEYFLYTIEGTETIPDKWGKRLMSFDIDDIEVKSLYKYDEQRWGKQTIRFISFANDEDHNLGDTPIPNGDVRIFSQTDAAGRLRSLRILRRIIIFSIIMATLPAGTKYEPGRLKSRTHGNCQLR